MSNSQNPTLTRRAEIARMVPVMCLEHGVNTNDLTVAGRERFVAFLHACVDLYRRRGLAGDWTYCPINHGHVNRALRAEQMDLALAVQEERRRAHA